MSSSSSNSWASFWTFLAYFFIAGAVAQVVQAIAATVTALLVLAENIFLAYFVAWVLVVVAGTVSSLIWQRRQGFGISWESEDEIFASRVPRHTYLLKRDYLDHHLWLVIQFDLLERIQKRDGRTLSSAGHLRNAEEFFYYPQALLADPRKFDTWRRQEFNEVLESETATAALAMIRQELHRQYLGEMDGSLPKTRLASTIHGASDRFVTLQDPWFLLRFGVHLLTFLRVYRGIDSAEIQERRRKQARWRLETDGQLFDLLLERRFFTIMADLGPYQLRVPLAHWLRHRAEQQGAQKFLKAAAARLALESATARRERLAERQAQEQQRLKSLEEKRVAMFEATATAKARALRLEELQGLYLRDRPLIILFDQFAAGDLEFHKEIEECAREDVGSPEAIQELLSRIAESQKAFERFWKEHEFLILTRHDKRAAFQNPGETSTGIPDERMAIILDKALSRHQEEQALLQVDQHIPVHAELGYLLALARIEVKERNPTADQDTIEGYLGRELKQLLVSAESEEQFTGKPVQRALEQCEDFRLGFLAHAPEVDRAGWRPTDSRDALAVAFVKNNDRWREEYWRRTFPLFLKGKHEWQTILNEFFRSKHQKAPKNSEELTAQLPEVEKAVRKNHLDRKKDQEHSEKHL